MFRLSKQPTGCTLISAVRHVGHISVAATILSLTACSLGASTAKESVIGATGKFGSESFTLVGGLPADFKMDIQIWYGPIEKGPHCEFYDVLAERTVKRTHGKVLKDEFQTTAHTATFDIPLTYSVGLCAMKLGRVELTIGGRYGDREDQNTISYGGFYIVKDLPKGAPEFNAAGELAITGHCEWLFKQSHARAYLGELEKVLKCQGAGAYLPHAQLANKTVRLEIKKNPEERPYYKETWIKFPDGWKPCATEDKGWIWCRTPATFKTFKMNGQTCSIYPGCTE